MDSTDHVPNTSSDTTSKGQSYIFQKREYPNLPLQLGEETTHFQISLYFHTHRCIGSRRSGFSLSNSVSEASPAVFYWLKVQDGCGLSVTILWLV